MPAAGVCGMVPSVGIPSSRNLVPGLQGSESRRLVVAAHVPWQSCWAVARRIHSLWLALKLVEAVSNLRMMTRSLPTWGVGLFHVSIHPETEDCRIPARVPECCHQTVVTSTGHTISLTFGPTDETVVALLPQTPEDGSSINLREPSINSPSRKI